jgi:hypothetical protein
MKKFLRMAGLLVLMGTAAHAAPDTLHNGGTQWGMITERELKQKVYIMCMDGQPPSESAYCRCVSTYVEKFSDLQAEEHMGYQVLTGKVHPAMVAFYAKCRVEASR